jgi:hypothetical protein
MDKLCEERHDTTTIVVWSISLIFISFSIYTCILLYLANRSLWLDEAMLAYSFNTRTLSNLTSSIFEWDQSAPIIYLYIVKIITMIFGTSETTLRIFSLFAYIVTLVLSYILLDRAFHVKYPILGVAFISNMSVLLYYSNEFKPYMNDCFSVLLVLYLYYLFSEKRISFSLLSVIYVILLWLSYPTIFFIGGVLIYEFINSIIKKDKRLMRKIIFGGIIVLFSFLIHYLIWLRPVANDEYMVNFWKGYRFPLIPTSLEDVKRIFFLAGKLIINMKYGMIFIGSLIVAGACICVGKRNKYGIIILISIFLILLASYIEKYPFYQRLMLFIYPILGISIFIAIDALIEKKSDPAEKIVIGGLIIAVLLSNYSSVLYLEPSGRYKEKQEVNKLIEYVDENIEKNQMLYVYYHTIPVFGFKNGYDNSHIGQNVDESIENIILGEDFSGAYKEDIEAILNADECYILMSHYLEEQIAPLMKGMTENGYLELVMEEYSTPLYFHTNELSKIKTKVQMELIDYHVVQERGTIHIKITNTGDVYFNTRDIDNIYIMSKENPNLEFNIKQRDIKPGEAIVIKCEFQWPDTYSMMDIQLANKSKYWFDEIGVSPIILYR